MNPSGLGTASIIDRAFRPFTLLPVIMGLLPHAGIKARLWRFPLEGRMPMATAGLPRLAVPPFASCAMSRAPGRLRVSERAKRRQMDPASGPSVDLHKDAF
jgi:hypothetical protein